MNQTGGVQGLIFMNHDGKIGYYKNASLPYGQLVCPDEIGKLIPDKLRESE